MQRINLSGLTATARIVLFHFLEHGEAIRTIDVAARLKSSTARVARDCSTDHAALDRDTLEIWQGDTFTGRNVQVPALIPSRALLATYGKASAARAGALRDSLSRVVAGATITAGGSTLQPGPDTGMATGRAVLVALEHARHVLAQWDGETL